MLPIPTLPPLGARKIPLVPTPVPGERVIFPGAPVPPAFPPVRVMLPPFPLLFTPPVPPVRLITPPSVPEKIGADPALNLIEPPVPLGSPTPPSTLKIVPPSPAPLKEKSDPGVEVAIPTKPDETTFKALLPTFKIEVKKLVVVAFVVVELPWILTLLATVKFPFALIERAAVVEVAKVEGLEVAR